MKKTFNLLPEDLEEIEYLKSFKYDKQYLELLAELNVLDDLEDWPLYQKMEEKKWINIDEKTEVYLKPHRY